MQEHRLDRPDQQTQFNGNGPVTPRFVTMTQKELDDRIQQAVDERREQLEREAIIHAGREAAHILNNDITIATGVLDLLKDQGCVPPKFVPLLELASTGLQTASLHMTRMIAGEKIEEPIESKPLRQPPANTPLRPPHS